MVWGVHGAELALLEPVAVDPELPWPVLPLDTELALVGSPELLPLSGAGDSPVGPATCEHAVATHAMSDAAGMRLIVRNPSRR